jgi:ATP-binding cassette subfamily F protein 3
VIEILDLSLRYGPQIVFDGISCHLSTRDRIGLAGRNGAGKSSFLKALLGELEVDGGKVHVGRGMTLGYLPQDGICGDGMALIEEVELAETSIQSLQRALEQAYAQVTASTEGAETDDDFLAEAWEDIHRMEDELRLRESHKLRARAEKILFGLGFSSGDMQKNTRQFSGGWQMRIALAKLLLKHPDYLLLDEPTNHLDLPSQRWLEQYLAGYRGGLVVISHDRAFLDLLTQRTFAISQGQLQIFEGNYSYYEQQRRLQREQLEARKVTQDRQLEKMQDFIDRFRAKATKAAQAQSRIKQMEKIERIEIEQDESGVFFRFPPSPASNQLLLSVEGLSKAYGNLRLFDGFDLKIERGQRLAVVGANGAGKSTLARMLAGEEAPDGGVLRLGEKTRLAYFAQHQTDRLNPDHHVLESAVSVGGCSEQLARDILGSFLFKGDAVFKKVSVLSGGEKNRLALARMLLKPANLIILDEPTNHLDLQSKEILQDALRHFDGSLLIISHDRAFLDPLVDHTLEVSPKGHRMFWCNVSAYLEKTEEEARQRLAVQSQGGGLSREVHRYNPKAQRRARAELQQLLLPLRKRLQQAEDHAISIETAIEDWERRLADPAFFASGVDRSADLKAYHDVKASLDSAMKEWELAQKQLETAQAEAELP